MATQSHSWRRTDQTMRSESLVSTPRRSHWPQRHPGPQASLRSGPSCWLRVVHPTRLRLGLCLHFTNGTVFHPETFLGDSGHTYCTLTAHRGQRLEFMETADVH